ncbi:MAG TPA: DUF3017 domain-containing protein [Streptosporangiaceae bacterium]|nr:DUF3017 domain-containing protein [Streptosporangiaceae bacterium]
MGDIAPPPDAAAPRTPPGPAAPRTPPGPARAGPARAGHRATRSIQGDEPAVTGVLAWLPYLVILAAAAVAMFIVSKGSAYALRGIAVLGGTLLAAALARLLLPNRFAGLLASRRKASDVLAFAVLGAAVLAVALSLP